MLGLDRALLFRTPSKKVEIRDLYLSFISYGYNKSITFEWKYVCVLEGNTFVWINSLDVLTVNYKIFFQQQFVNYIQK